MTTQQYEHHLSLRQDKLCPFKIKTSRSVRNSVCNWHRNIEILVVFEGEGHVQYGADDISVSAHDVIVVDSGTLHRPYSEKGIGFHYIIIDESFCAENGIETERRRFERCFKDEVTEKLCLAALDRFNEYKESATQISTARLREAVLSLLINICEQHSAGYLVEIGVAKPSEEYVKKTLEYLGDHFTEQISLENVASLCGVTKYHLAREFKRYTGQTVFTYINILRCKRAELCLSRGMTVTEAAWDSGFESVSYFSRTYKKLMGKSPSGEKKHGQNLFE